MKRWKDIVVRK